MNAFSKVVVTMLIVLVVLSVIAVVAFFITDLLIQRLYKNKK